MLTVAQRQWIFLCDEDHEFDENLAKDAGISEVASKILQQREFLTKEEVNDFLHPKLGTLHDPELLPDMDKATERLCRAIKKRELILLFGDYDVDGTTGSAVLHRILTALGAKVDVYIPDRFTDGYGLTPATLKKVLPKKPAAIVISIDNGIVAFPAADYLKEVGVDLIITDHHAMRGTDVPDCLAAIHPRAPGSEHPNKNLCGAGVAFKLAWGTAKRHAGGEKVTPSIRKVMMDCLGLVSMGTVADIVPLVGENRTLTRHGLKSLEKGNLVGVRALLQISEADYPLTAGAIGYKLGPRINAAGRLGSALRAFELLTSSEVGKSWEIAEELDKENNRRREIEKELSFSAHAQARDLYGECPKAAGLVLADENWHEGVVGIVASRICDSFNRPSLVLSILEDGVTAKGSGRSALKVDLKAALDECADLLIGYGGHSAAAGLRLKVENIPALRDRFAKVIAVQLGYEEGTTDIEEGLSSVKIDARISMEEIDKQLMGDLELMSPFGMGNRTPVFAAKVYLAGDLKFIGKDKAHIAFKVFSKHDEKKRIFRAVAFGRADLYDDIQRHGMELLPFFHSFQTKA